MSTAPQVYCKSAIFTCTCCCYATTIYSDTEWLLVSESPSCVKCKGACKKMDNQGIIFRNDIDEDFPLHMQMCRMPGGKQHCESSIHHDSRINWTELLVNCPICLENTMLFTAYITGKHILQFYEECVDSAKPSHPNIEWIKDGGNKYIAINGPGSKFSAT